ncbi:hypothetical protein AB4Z48_14420 [Cupriavidus sp. 2TAF22]
MPAISQCSDAVLLSGSGEQIKDNRSVFVCEILASSSNKSCDDGLEVPF